MDPASRPEFNRLVAELRAAGDRRMSQRAERRAQFAQITQKALALQARQLLQAPQHDAGAHREEQRRQRRAQHEAIMTQAVQACREESMQDRGGAAAPARRRAGRAAGRTSAVVCLLVAWRVREQILW